MARLVYHYSSLEQLLEDNKWIKNKNIPIMTATCDFATLLERKYPNKKENICNYEEFYHIILPEWNNEKTKFKMYLELSNLISPYAKKNNIYCAYRRNLREVLEGIRMLEECNITPDSIPDKKEYQFFKKVWIELEKQSLDITNLQSILQFQLMDKSIFKNLISKTKVANIKDKLLLVGFYYITPIQERIFEIFEKHGVELIFLNSYDARFKEVYKIWEETFSDSIYKKQSQENQIFKEGNNEFCKLFENDDNITFHNVKIVKYKTEEEFIFDINRIKKEGYKLFATNTSQFKQVMMEYFPQEFEKRHLLSYPVGQFVYYLHMMWDEELGELALNKEMLHQCFASGWLEYKGIHGKNYLKDLDDIYIYFQDCYTVKQWKERLYELKCKKEYSNYFDVTSGTENMKRWHRIMGNPFLNFSAFAKDIETTENIVFLIEHLIKIAEYLFKGNSKIDIYQHLKKVKTILEEKSDKCSILIEEKEVMDELIRRLEWNRNENLKCFPEDVADVVKLFIGGKFMMEDDTELLEENKSTAINQMYLLETAGSVYGSKIHLAGCDEYNLPGVKKEYPWPITDKMLDDLKFDCKQDEKYIRQKRNVVEGIIKINRYLFSQLLKNDCVEVSWIARNNNKDVQMSSYLQLIMMYQKNNREKQKKEELYNDIVRNFKKEDNTKKETAFLNEEEYYPEEVIQDANICNLRYFYGYVLKEFPYYSSEFHYNFAISSLITAISSLTNMNKKQVEKEVLAIFPYLRNGEKKQIKDFSYKFPLEKSSCQSELENILYPKERLFIHNLVKEVRERAEKRWEEYKEQVKNVKADLKLCKYCPHCDYCREYLRREDLELHSNESDKNKNEMQEGRNINYQLE